MFEDKNVNYSLAVGTCSALFTLNIFGILMCRRAEMEREQTNEQKISTFFDESITCEQLWTTFLVVWWGVGAGFGTFNVHLRACPRAARAPTPYHGMRTLTDRVSRGVTRRSPSATFTCTSLSRPS